MTMLDWVMAAFVAIVVGLLLTWAISAQLDVDVDDADGDE